MIVVSGLTLNKEILRIMGEMADGRIYRTEGGRDVRRCRSFNNPIGHAATKIGAAGLAEIRADAKWRLTPLGEQKKAEAEAAYAEQSVNSKAEVVKGKS